MRRSWNAGVLVVLLTGAGLSLLATRVRPAHAGAAAEPAPDPKKKKAGEPCKTSNECQKHHTCAKVGEQNVCQAPPRPQLPPGVVT